ncbi:BatA domain-containing protein [Neorhodopirellula pilleata]|uniref:Aerotolerance regulator N-terminal domain-containing protein n=1 Tax=Neorhodopirellula pilleata TaxID=2714738 RepID=A0A5C6AUW5_9BACT|nr:BatA domain-containing protein [Neorhodopirellula pilleata]TWU03795.1 hypothetical protein Pla100_07250 [Neorhodopirellula pilleata]
MSLLNAAMAFGTLAFVVPLAIHLLFRSRYRTMDWGAMFLLRDVVQANRRRMQWHHWILLALRCAIPLLLALAMARPLISSMRSMPGSQPISLIMVLDDSRSMSAARRSSEALSAVNQVFDSLSQKDEVILIRSSRIGSPVTTGSVRDAREQLRELRFDGAEAELDSMVAAGVEACTTASHPFRRVVVCSDFQENVLAAASPEVIEGLSERIESMTPPIGLDFLNIASEEPSDALGNVVVESIEIESPAVLVDHPSRMSAVVKNHSEASLPALRCVWAIDGADVHSENVSLSPRGSATLRWEHVFARVGGASVTLSVQHDDALSADNQRRLAIDVMRQIRVWLVDGDESDQPLQSETDFLKLALSPFAFQATRQSQRNTQPNRRDEMIQDTVSTKVVTSKSFHRSFAKLNLPNQGEEEVPDLIVFANVEELSNKEFNEAVVAYLDQGGSVLVFDGDQVAAESLGECEWLPASPMQTISLKDDSDETEGEVSENGSDKETFTGTFRIEPPGGRYAPWAVLGGSGDSLLDSVEFQRVRKLQPRDDRTEVLMRSESGLPLVVQRRSGEIGGRVVQFAIPCDTAWSNLPLRPVFLPLIQQLVLDLAGGAEGLNGPPGSMFMIPPPKGSAPSRWRLTTPDGKTKVLPASASEPVRYSDTTQVGIYRFVPMSDDGNETEKTSTTDAGEPHVAAVRAIDVSSDESILRAAAPELLQRSIERIGGRSFSSPSEWVAGAKQDRFGLEIWRPLIWILLIVLVAEVLWQQRGGTKARLPGKFAASNAPSRRVAASGGAS